MTTNPPSPLGATEVHDVDSVAAGDTFRIFVGECQPNPQSILLVTDANGLFGLAVDTVRMMQIPALVRPMLIVGIGYPDANRLVDAVGIRARDLTPTHDERFALSGRASAFTDFLTDELRPWLTQRFPDAVGDVTYFGHSLGGLYGAHLLVTRPELFDRYVLSSPSLWWDDRLVQRLEQSWAERHDDLEAQVYVGIGEHETDAGRREEGRALPEGHPAKPPSIHLDMVDDLERFASALGGRGYPGLTMEHRVFPDEFHATVPGVVLTHALRWFDLPSSR